jgi:hypothetical protein
MKVLEDMPTVLQQKDFTVSGTRWAANNSHKKKLMMRASFKNSQPHINAIIKAGTLAINSNSYLLTELYKEGNSWETSQQTSF